MTHARWTALGAPVALLLLAFALRTAGLQTQSYWYDEGYSVMFARNDPASIITQAARLELNTPLHYLALKLWAGLAGDQEFSTRLFSSACGVLVVALAGLLAAAVAKPGRPAARLWAMALTGLWPVNVATSQETRMYALVVLLSLASVAVLIIRCLRRNQRRDWALWGALCLAAFGTHVLAAFVVLAQSLVIAAWWLARRRQRFIVPVVAFATVALLMGAWAAWLWSWRVDYGTTFTAPLNIADTFVRSLAALALPRLQPEGLVAPAAALVALSMLGILLAGARSARLLAIVCGLSVAGIALLCVVTGKFAGRYPAIAAPEFSIALGLTLGTFRVAPRWVRALAGGAICAACAVGVLAWRIDPIYANEDFRGAAAHLRTRVRPGEPIVLVSGHLAPVFEYYYGPSGWRALPDDPVLDVNHQLDYESAVPATNEVLSGQLGAWLLLWQDDIVDPTAVAQSLMRRRSIDLAPSLDSADFHGLRLQHYRFFDAYQPLPERLPDMAATVQPTDRQRGLGALGCTQFEPARAGDAHMEIACFWNVEPDSPVPVGTKVSLRLMDGTGRQVAQSDQPIAPKGLPYIPYRKPIASFYVFPLPPDLPAGNYTVRAIPYTDVEQISPEVAFPLQVLP